MKFIRNKNGIALVTSLMFTLITLGIVMALLLMITRGTTVSGLNKRYKTALEASYGGTEIFTKDMFPFILRNYSGDTSLKTNVETAFGGSQLISPQVAGTSKTCLQYKLTNSTSDWPSGCSNTPSPKQS